MCNLGMIASLGVLFYSILPLSLQIKQGYDGIDTISKSVVMILIPVKLLLFLYLW